jgi:hypothetical protein
VRLRWPIWDKEKLQHLGKSGNVWFHLGKPLNKRPLNRIIHQKMFYTRPSYKDKAWGAHGQGVQRLCELRAVVRTCTIVGSCLLPSTNSSYVSLASLSRSMLLKIFSTRYCRERSYCGGHREGATEGHTYLLRRVLIHRKFDHRSCHLVDRLYDLEHFIMCDGAVSVNIVQLECP